MKKEYFNLDLIKGLILGFIGGFLELYSLSVRGAFTGMQTGNLMNIFTDLIDNNYSLALFRFIILISFILGVILSEVIFVIGHKFKFNYEHIVFPLMIILLIPTLVIDPHLEILDPLNIFSVICLALFGAMQSHIFSTINNHPSTTTMITAMIKQISANYFLAIKNKDRKCLCIASETLLIVLCFIIGIIAFYLPYKFFIDIEYVNFFILLIVILLLILYSFTLFSKNEDVKEEISLE